MPSVKRKKTITYGMIFSAIIFAIILFFSRYRFPLELFPKNDTFFDFDIISNTDDKKSFSEAVIDHKSGHLHFRYNFASQSNEPFAVLLFHAHELARRLNLADYQHINIDIDPTVSNDFTISLYMYVPGFSDPVLTETHRPYSIKCRVVPGKTQYHYKITDFATPAWWFSAYEVDDETLPKTNWNNLTHLTISDFGYIPSDTTLQVSLIRMRFIDSVYADLLFALIGGLALFFAYGYFLTYLRKKKNKHIHKSLYYKGARKSYTDEESKILLTYLNDTFRNPLLTLEKIKKDIGLNSFQVNEILKDLLHTQYKPYIHQLRIDEAKHMLTTTEHQIVTIAERVGYCYSNSFSRIFRQLEGLSPNEYRQKHSEK